MRKQCLTLLEGLILFLMGASLFLYPTQSAQGARVGVNLCLELLIPSLFPFFVLSSLFIATGFVQICSKPTEGMMRRVFGVSGPGAAAFCLDRRLPRWGQGSCAAGGAKRLFTKGS